MHFHQHLNHIAQRLAACAEALTDIPSDVFEERVARELLETLESAVQELEHWLPGPHHAPQPHGA